MYSQNGEDLVLESIFSSLGITKGFFVDVGAWDGRHLSNTYWSVLKGWDGLEIEGNEVYVQRAIKLLPSNIHVFCKYIKAEELDNILGLYAVPNDFDLLSIDIDTYDYWVWKHLVKYSPKVVIIESNSREGIVVQEPNTPEKIGASPQALKNLAEEKGYCFVKAVKGNLIFMRKDIYESTQN